MYRFRVVMEKLRKSFMQLIPLNPIILNTSPHRITRITFHSFSGIETKFPHTHPLSYITHTIIKAHKNSNNPHNESICEGSKNYNV